MRREYIMRNFFTFRRWERHGLVLMVSGLMYIALGSIIFIVKDDLTEDRLLSLVAATNIAPMLFWSIVFIIVGVFTCVSSRWPSFSANWGYMMLTGLSTGWATMYLVGYLLNDAPVTNLNLSLVWGALGFLWWAISGLINPVKPPKQPRTTKNFGRRKYDVLS